MKLCANHNRAVRRSVTAAALALAGALVGVQAAQAQRVPEQYILTLAAGVDPDEQGRALGRELGAQVLHTYRHALNGLALRLPAQAAEALKRRPGVLAVEQDQVMSNRQSLVTQANAVYGIDRVNQRSLPLDGLYSYANTASGIRVYVIDTGVLATHTEFGSRVLPGYTAINDGRGSSDCDGHGTHVAGTVGGATYGVAKGVAIVPVRVLDCGGSGTVTGVIAGVDWVAANATAGSVANMSLGGGASAALDTAVGNLVGKGVVTVVAAGNSNVDACTSSPGRAPSAITVGATTSTDARASYSNFGSCVDLFAPGSGITSAWFTSNTAISTLNGTSMASPHVAGVAALLRANNPSWGPAEVAAELLRSATTGVVTGAGVGSPNLLVYSLPTAAPVARDVAVASLSGTTAKASKGKTATWTWAITAKAYDVKDGSAVSGATITGVVTGGGKSTTVSCTTGSTSSCTMPTVSFPYGSVASANFSVSNITGTGLAYQPASNVSNSLVVVRP